MTAVGLVRHRIPFLRHVSWLPYFASGAFFYCLIDFVYWLVFFCFCFGKWDFQHLFLSRLYLVLGSWHCLTPYAAASRTEAVYLWCCWNFLVLCITLFLCWFPSICIKAVSKFICSVLISSASSCSMRDLLKNESTFWLMQALCLVPVLTGTLKPVCHRTLTAISQCSANTASREELKHWKVRVPQVWGTQSSHNLCWPTSQ